MIALMFAAIVGGAVTFACLVPAGLLVAALLAPFGGSAAALAVAVVVVLVPARRGSVEVMVERKAI